MHYIVGLGNPGEQYTHTRHNIGREVLLFMQQKKQLPDWQKSKAARALYTHTEAAELLLPDTFMNQSGETLRYVCDKQAAQINEFVVVHDDVDLPFGEMKIAVGRGDGGHNGLRSIISSLKSKDFIRVRLGVSPKSFWTGKVRRPAGDALATFVLGRFSMSEKKQLPEVFEKVTEAIEMITDKGVEAAMNKFN